MSTHKKKNTDTYKTYIYRILKDVHPSAGITEKGMNVVNDLISKLFVQMKAESLKLVRLAKKQTLKSRDIMFATNLLLPGEIRKHAISELAKAITNYKSNEGGGKMTRATRAGLIMGVGRIERHLRLNNKVRISSTAAVAMAAVLEYVTAELLELAGNSAANSKKKRIIPRHLKLAIIGDEELSRLFRGATISEGGVRPFVHPALLPKKKKSRAN